MESHDIPIWTDNHLFSVAAYTNGLLVVRWLVTPDASMSVFVHIVSDPSNICTIHGPSAFQPVANSDYVR